MIIHAKIVIKQNHQRLTARLVFLNNKAHFTFYKGSNVSRNAVLGITFKAAVYKHNAYNVAQTA